MSQQTASHERGNQTKYTGGTRDDYAQVRETDNDRKCKVTKKMENKTIKTEPKKGTLKMKEHNML